jgi:hypothetical protein
MIEDHFGEGESADRHATHVCDSIGRPNVITSRETFLQYVEHHQGASKIRSIVFKKLSNPDAKASNLTIDGSRFRRHD